QLRGRPDHWRAGSDRPDPGVLSGHHPGRRGHRRRPSTRPGRVHRSASQRLNRPARSDQVPCIRPSGIPAPPPRREVGPSMHVVAIGGSDAGISAALRARELDPAADVTVAVADAYPNFSICGIPYYISGEVTDWRNLAHRSHADLEATGMRLRLDSL